MKKQNNVFRPRLLGYCALLLLSPLFFLAACKNGQPHGGGSPAKEFKMNCMMLNRAQMQTWIDSGWTKPDSKGEIKDIVFQFYSPDITGSTTNMQLIAYPGESASNVKLTGEQLLTSDTTCKAVSFTGQVILANNEANIEKLGILTEEGKLKDFDYIRFTPQPFSLDKKYLTFKVELIVKGQVQAGDYGDTNPCPPFCCPPHCPEP